MAVIRKDDLEVETSIQKTIQQCLANSRPSSDCQLCCVDCVREYGSNGGCGVDDQQRNISRTSSGGYWRWRHGGPLSAAQLDDKSTTNDGDEDVELDVTNASSLSSLWDTSIV